MTYSEFRLVVVSVVSGLGLSGGSERWVCGRALVLVVGLVQSIVAVVWALASGGTVAVLDEGMDWLGFGNGVEVGVVEFV